MTKKDFLEQIADEKDDAKIYLQIVRNGFFGELWTENVPVEGFSPNGEGKVILVAGENFDSKDLK
jgi:hypothetical protein